MALELRGLKLLVMLLSSHTLFAATSRSGPDVELGGKNACAEHRWQGPVCNWDSTVTEEAKSSAPSLLQQRSLLRSAVHLPAQPSKFLAGVPVYNYDYVRLCDDDGLCLLEEGATEAQVGSPNADGNEQDRQIRRKRHLAPGQVRQWIVKLRDGSTNQVVAAFCDDMRGRTKCTAKGHPSEGGVPMVVVRASEAALEEQLYRHMGTSDFVEPDISMEAIPEVRVKEDLNNNSKTGSSLGHRPKTASWGLDRIDDREGLDGSYDIGINGGQDVHVYVADTGILTTHEEFQGRARPAMEILDSGEIVECHKNDHKCAQDVNGHGTHAAGTVGGRTYGVAKAATLHSIKILSDAGKGKMSYLIQALDWVVANGQRPAIFMASLECPGNPPSVVKAIEAAVAAGVTVIVAAGNFGRDACGYSPAHIGAAITVAATDSPDDRLASYSNYGSCVDIFAPGSNIVSAGMLSNSSKATMSGTSMACPHVAGAAALLLGEDRTRTPEEVLMLLQARATQGVVKGLDETGTSNLMLFTAELDAGDELYVEAAFGPRSSFRWQGWNDIFARGPLKEHVAEACVCALFLFALVFMTFRCGRFIGSTPGTADAV